jgi:cell division protease FtsH
MKEGFSPVAMFVSAAFLVLVLLLLAGGSLVLARLRGHRRFLARHIGRRCDRADILTQPLRHWERINYYLALEHLRKQAGTALLIHGGGCCSLTFLVDRDLPRGGARLKRLTCGLDEALEVVENGVYLVYHDGEPICVNLFSDRSADDFDMPSTATTVLLEILAASPAAARAAADHIMELAQKCNVYRGKILALVETPHGGDRYRLQFHDLPAVRRDEIILPAELMEVVERNVLGFLTHAETLRRSGRSTRHGVLLHGPPGVGKTLLTRYLVRACTDYTAILLTGQNLRFISESMLLARLLAPSIVVFEDVDLVAEERTTNRFGGVLHELLDALDGLGRKTDCIVLLTTNRADLLEPALAARPGRVDQAICIDLPDADCRRRLLALYGHGLDLSITDLEAWVGRTEGVSPAFLAEWLRKTALMAAERGETDPPLRVTEADLEKAFRELVLFGGKVTQNILGYRGGLAPP